jgi:3-oxoacyl-[acyl-carrier protein] reductase
MDINLSTAFYAIRAAMPHMLKTGYGRIILIGSSAFYDGGGGAIDYAAGKAGLVGMMTYLCKNYARKGILTNVVHPCVIETDLLKERYNTEEKKKKLTDQIPVGRLGQPEDIAGLVAFLASSWGDFICGQSILVDGGRTLF